MSPLASLLLLGCAALCVHAWIDTVPELDVNSYVGRWYNVFGNRIFLLNRPFAVCTMADYGVYNASALTLFNANRLDTPTGSLNTITGLAYTTEEPGKLLVQFTNRPFFAPYWVIKLGPVGDDGLYEYAVTTSDAIPAALFVLVRRPEEFKEKYEAEVLSFVEEKGFTDFFMEPVAIYHGDDCLYPEGF